MESLFSFRRQCCHRHPQTTGGQLLTFAQGNTKKRELQNQTQVLLVLVFFPADPLILTGISLLAASNNSHPRGW